MAVMYDNQPIPSELEAIRESDGFVELKDNEAFQKLLVFMEGLVTEAEQEKDNNLSSDAQLTWNLQWRWRQRRDMVLAAKQYIEIMIQSRMEVLNTLTEEQYGNDTDQ